MCRGSKGRLAYATAAAFAASLAVDACYVWGVGMLYDNAHVFCSRHPPTWVHSVCFLMRDS